MITPGELAPGMLIAVIDGRPVVEPDTWREPSAFGVVFFFGDERAETPPDMGQVLAVKAVNLPLVLTVNIITSKAAVYDTRKLQFREITKEFAREYHKAMRRKGRK